MSHKGEETGGKCFLCSRTIWPDDATTTAAGLAVHRVCYDKFVRPGLLPDPPKTARRDDR